MWLDAIRLFSGTSIPLEWAYSTRAISPQGHWFLEGEKVLDITMICDLQKTTVHKALYTALSVLLIFHGIGWNYEKTSL